MAKVNSLWVDSLILFEDANLRCRGYKPIQNIDSFL